MSRRGEFLDAKVYIGGLPDDARSDEIEDVCHRYGRVRKVWIARRPPGFAFVEYEDSRDAEDAVRGLDGSRICGSKVKVELSHGKSRNSGGRGGGRGGDRSRRSRSPRYREENRASPRRSRSRTPQSPTRPISKSPRRSLSKSPRRSLSKSPRRSPPKSPKRSVSKSARRSFSRSPRRSFSRSRSATPQ